MFGTLHPLPAGVIVRVSDHKGLFRAKQLVDRCISRGIEDDVRHRVGMRPLLVTAQGMHPDLRILLEEHDIGTVKRDEPCQEIEQCRQDGIQLQTAGEGHVGGAQGLGYLPGVVLGSIQVGVLQGHGQRIGHLPRKLQTFDAENPRLAGEQAELASQFVARAAAGN